MTRRPYIRPVARYSWWLAQRRYVDYMLREATSFFIGAYTGVIIVGLVRLTQGRVAYEAFLDGLREPAGIAFHVVALLLALYHTTTWFHVTPKAMPVQLGAYRVPGAAIIGAHYLGWAVVSVAVFALAGM